MTCVNATSLPDVLVEVHLTAREWQEALQTDARIGLSSSPKWLPPTWLYDDLGSRLFDEITRLPEYYPTRAEHSILSERAETIAELVHADTLIELGAGTSAKTRVLLDAMASAGTLRRFVPFDIAEPTLRTTCDAIATEYPAISVHGIVGDIQRHLDCVPAGGRRLFAFLGGTIGNFTPTERAVLLQQISDTMAVGDSLLVGTDLVKDRRRLVAAYDDTAGVTAAFNKNVLAVLNHSLGADFDPTAFDHVARYDEDHDWIEMRLRSQRTQVVHVPALALTLHFIAGEDLRTEISAKFRPGVFATELTRAGLLPSTSFTDDAQDYSITVAVK